MLATSEKAGRVAGGGAVAMLRGTWLLWLGALALAVHPIADLAKQIWATEQGAHGPIILATGIWLIARRRAEVAAIARPGSPLVTALLLIPALLAIVFSRIVGWLGVECLAVQAVFMVVFYHHAGWRAVRLLWFPFIYFLFMYPEPEVITLPLTRVLKLWISTTAVDMLAALGYQVAQGGVVIFVDQYELLVASACSGLSSLIGLSSLGVFYAYMRHDGRWRPSLPLLAVIPFIAIAANFLRVILLIMITHYFGDAVAQSFIHDFAGIFMFLVGVIMMLGADAAITALREGPARRTA